MNQDGSPDDLGWSLDDIARYLALQKYLPKNGGLFGSGWAQFMARQGAGGAQASQSSPATAPPQLAGQAPRPAPLPHRIIPPAPAGTTNATHAAMAPLASRPGLTPSAGVLPNQPHRSAGYMARSGATNASPGSLHPTAATGSPPPRPLAGTYSAPRPSDGFVSWLFGGPVPLHGATGEVVGYYDHQAARAGLEITGHVADLAQNVYTPDVPVGLLEHIAPGAAAAIARAIDEWTEFHHPFPKFMGGPLRQGLEALKAWRHRLFHADLASALREAVPLPVGGRAGSRDQWLEHFAKFPEAEDQAIEILRRVTAEFDRAHGSSITPKLEKALESAGKGKPPS